MQGKIFDDANFYNTLGADDNPSAYSLLCELLQKYNIAEIEDKLGIHSGTSKRWLSQQKVPNNYFNDLNHLLGTKYTPQDTYRQKDQFYTNEEVSLFCYKKTLEVLTELGIEHNKYTFIEPSAGCCNFYNLLPAARRIGVDIDPKGALAKELICSNYLDFTPECKNSNSGKYIVIGNPPFGLRGNLALRFINHSAQFADVVAFILPPLFNSTGKGVPMKRVNPEYSLAYSQKLPQNSFMYPDGRAVDIATIFQVWTKLGKDKIKTTPQQTCKGFARVYSLSDGGTPSSTRNKKMLDCCDVYLPSTCFSGMAAYKSFAELPNKRGYGIVFLQQKERLKQIFFNDVCWKDVAFLSTNSALNLRTDLIEQQLIIRGFYDK